MSTYFCLCQTDCCILYVVHSMQPTHFASMYLYGSLLQTVSKTQTAAQVFHLYLPLLLTGCT